jgi:mannose-6-phosphate isomerase-like protein (cupin superfamily)
MTFGVALIVMGLISAPQAQTAKPRAATPAVTTTTVALTVTDGKGAPINGVTVRVSGPVDREGSTAAGGALRLEGLRSGTYRFRFVHDEYITLERDVSIPAGQRALDQHVMLSDADKPAPPPPAPVVEPAKPVNKLPPPGKAVIVSLPAYIEQNFIGGSQPQKVSSVACSGLGQSVLWQVRDPWQERLHANADAMLYTIGGEGTLRMSERDLPLQAGTFVSVPRGTTYSLTRRGRNPLVVLATLSGEACTP